MDERIKLTMQLEPEELSLIWRLMDEMKRSDPSTVPTRQDVLRYALRKATDGTR